MEEMNINIALEKLNIWLGSTCEGDPVHEELLVLAQEYARRNKQMQDIDRLSTEGDIIDFRQAELDIIERFYKDLEFGTGGLRGVLGAGMSRMNVYTIARAAQGIADYIIENDIEKSVALAYDTRINSRLFAETVAGVYIANGIKVYMYKDVSIVPQLSYATRTLGCGMGTIVTASHNPAKYNGYKVYCACGYQITDAVAKEIFAHIQKLDIFRDVKKMDFIEVIKHPNFIWLGDDLVEKFVSASMEKIGLTSSRISHVESNMTAFDKDNRKNNSKMTLDTNNLSVVYTPLNGAGLIPIKKMFEKLGMQNVHIVPEQEHPDGNFPTCTYPNPEKKEALSLGLALCEKVGADILIATDPDCDRVGVAAKMLKMDSASPYKENGNSEQNESDKKIENDLPCYKVFSGNEIGILLFEYILRTRKENGTLPHNPEAIRSIVTTKIVDRIAEKYGVKMNVTLTGFKYMGELITKLEQEGRAEDFIFAFEESYGYLGNAHARDKDGVNAAMLICQMADSYKAQGISLEKALDKIYKEYGYEEATLQNFDFEGIAGAKKMQDIMKMFSENPPKVLLNRSLVQMIDYKKCEVLEPASAPKEVCSKSEQCDFQVIAETGLPSSNTLEYEYENKDECEITFTIRPSGTEPKIKIYSFARGNDRKRVESLSEDLNNALRRIIENE